MANVRCGNSWYVDTVHASSSDDLVQANILVTHIVVTATAGIGRIVLSDTSGSAKIDLRVTPHSGTSGDSRIFDFSGAPLLFPNGIQVTTLTTAVATIVGRLSGS